MENIFKTIESVNAIVNGYVWGVPMLCLILFTGMFYTIRTKAFQITHAKDVYDNTIHGLFVKKDKTNEKQKNVISQFQALTTALAATIGTGNIAGVSTAIFVGGPGAVFWMWVCAIFGMMTHYAEITLGLYFREKTDNGYKGGAMYYLEHGVGGRLGLKTFGKILAVAFALFAFIASFGIGNMTQVNSISEALKANFGAPSLITGLILALIATLVIMGGITRIGQVTEKVVPAMSLFYIMVGLVICVSNYRHIPSVFKMIFTSAISMKAIYGGVFGTILKRAMTYGFKRGAFSNEAGLGTSVFAHTASDVKEPVKQGMWGIFEVFFDTIIVCTFTALIVLSSSITSDTLQNRLQNLDINEQIVSISDNINADNTRNIVNSEVYHMPIKLDLNNNALLYTEIPDQNKNYMTVTAYGKQYYVEALDENDKANTENDFFFGNALRVYANPVKLVNGDNLMDDETGEPKIDSIHIEKINGASLVTLAVSSKLSHIAGKLLAIAITLFAFSTVLGWSYYGTKSAEYLFGNIGAIIYKLLFIAFIVVGSVMNLNLVWDISDTLNGLMALPNLIGVVLLSGTLVSITKNYYDRKKGLQVKEDISFFQK